MIRGFTTALVLSMTFASGARARTSDPALAAIMEASAKVAEASAADVATPTRSVAERARAVLQDHRNEQAWQELALAIPELAIAGGADLETTFAAARLAEELGREPATERIQWGRGDRGATESTIAASSANTEAVASTRASDAPAASEGGGVLAIFSADTLDDVGRAAALLVQDLLAALAAFGTTIVVWLSGASRDLGGILDGVSAEQWGLIAQGAAFLVGVYVLANAATSKSRKARGTKRPAGGKTRRSAPANRTFASARALWDDGVPIHEIARQTGLARDAVAVLLSRTQAVPA